MCMDVHYNLKPYFRLIPHHDGQWAKNFVEKTTIPNGDW